MLEFVDSDLYFVQDKNNFINPLLQVGSGSGSVSVEKSTGSGSGGPKITGSDRIRIRILIPALNLQYILCLFGMQPYFSFAAHAFCPRSLHPFFIITYYNNSVLNVLDFSVYFLNQTQKRSYQQPNLEFVVQFYRLCLLLTLKNAIQEGAISCKKNYGRGGGG